jgi:Tol biopolymer transport system component
MAKRLALLALLAGVLAAVPGPHDSARAAVPGTNGRIAFVRSAGAGPLEEVLMANPGIGPGPVVNLTNDPFTSDTAPSWSPDGTRVALQRSGPTAGIWILDAAAGTMGFVPHTDHGFQPSWSPDGSWIAFSRDVGADAELWKVRTDGSHLTRLTNNAAEDWEAAWSPDGSRIAFTREGLGGTTSIMVLAAGGGAEKAVTPAGGFDGAPDWSPDGKRIGFSRFLPGEGNRIFTAAPSGKGLTQVTFGGGPTAFNDVHPAWSPDGTRIAFARGGDQDDGLPLHIHTVALADGSTSQVTGGKVQDLMPSWQPL